MLKEVSQMKVTELKAGLKVYHKHINQNLIVIHASYDGIVCMDIRETQAERFGTMIVSATDLQKGWKTTTEIQLDRLKRLKDNK